MTSAVTAWGRHCVWLKCEPASLHSLAYARTDLQGLATTHIDLCSIVRRTNAVFGRADSGQLVSLFFVQLEPANRTFTYASAGHRAYLIHADGTYDELASTGPLLGLFPDIEITESEPIILQTGDVLFIPTDGIEESQTPGRQLFGKYRMLEVVANDRASTAEAMFDAVCRAAHEFAEGKPQADDMTAVFLRVVDPSGA
ncbi:MAG: PP2C family protein-serine/threonine phosphatase [Planctomycetales bacterium]